MEIMSLTAATFFCLAVPSTLSQQASTYFPLKPNCGAVLRRAGFKQKRLVSSYRPKSSGFSNLNLPAWWRQSGDQLKDQEIQHQESCKHASMKSSPSPWDEAPLHLDAVKLSLLMDQIPHKWLTLSLLSVYVQFIEQLGVTKTSEFFIIFMTQPSSYICLPSVVNIQIFLIN